LKRTIHTIGHSTHTLEEFLALLQSCKIKHLADVRRFPGSRKFPQFDHENLEAALSAAGIGYTHLEELGGRRKAQPGSRNTRWRNAGFRGYADYMETAEFNNGLDRLEALALQAPTVYMCAEAVWWSCHRALVSDRLKVKGWTVLHIMAPGKTQEHPYTAAARVEGNRVFYDEKELFDRWP
jgi:uncharacterized protein (DUF488 family)